eukprot:TRINITY_DN15651_c0_g1_i1.p1 TRINITY_DN15651_c0_g1~~TRINITY_DN15651_c0_g1_i1.p1  ORF type:complete len:186 (+),score=28.26 TRINITY_DN15651_c0_g1_i1:424-981(+)
MGMQLLSALAANNMSVVVLNAFDSENLSLSLELTSEAAASTFFQQMPDDVKSILTTQTVTCNLHHDGVPPEFFQSNANLSSVFRLLSTNHDRRGRPFASTIEAHGLPIYATQWHPERPLFDWDETENITHTADAIRAMQYTANFFVGQTRKSVHRFSSPQSEQQALIYNYPVTDVDGSYQVYFLD